MKHYLPLVSVIIPCFNQGNYLHECIQSVISSYNGPLEIIVVDDGSNDPKTIRILDQIRSTPHDGVIILTKKNGGLSSARNAGIQYAKGAFIQLLDADDVILPGKIDVQIQHLKQNAHIDISICNYLLSDESRTHFSKPCESIAHFTCSIEDFLFKWERGFVVPIHCALFKRSIFDTCRFDEELKGKEDWEFWCKTIHSGFVATYFPAHLAIYRQHDQSMRRSVLTMGKNWLLAAAKIDSFVKSSYANFYDSCVDWFNFYYRQHPDYQTEINGACLASLSVEATDHTEQDFDLGNTQHRLNSAIQHWTSKPVESKPTITVVVPIYNHIQHLEECLASIIDQTSPANEVICIDDNSPDPRVKQLLSALTRHEKIKIIYNQRNLGISVSQNLAVAQAIGQYIAFLDCDDYLSRDALKKVRERLASEEFPDYLFTDRIDIDEKGKKIRHAVYGGYPQIPPSEDHYRQLFEGMIASHLKTIRTESYLAHNGCNDKFSGVQDWDLALKIAATGRLTYLPEPLYYHRIHSKSVTQSDSVSQFRKTNEVRRYHLESTFPNRTNREILINKPAKNAELLNLWKQGNRIVFDANAQNNATQTMNYLREYNSYYDSIITNSAEMMGGLIGYCWSTQTLEWKN